MRWAALLQRVFEIDAFRCRGWAVVRRYLDGDQLIWEYADGGVTRMDRICTLPEDQKIPEPRGRRFRFFD